MPELPEVETIRLQLERAIVGLTIKSIEVKTAKIFQGNKDLIIGKKILQIRRSGKMLVIDLSGGHSLAIHLKLTGRIIIADKNKTNRWDVDYPTDKHTHIIINLSNDKILYYHDVRKFGFIKILKTQDISKLSLVEKQGPEFLKDLTLEKFRLILEKSNLPIKALLMDQQKMAGAGNIYANEALWCALINPQERVTRLRRTCLPAGRASARQGDKVKILFDCLNKILKQAIVWKGASDNDYRDAFGAKGEVQEHFEVYNRKNKPCRRCGTPIVKIQLSGRGTYFCPKCQK